MYVMRNLIVIATLMFTLGACAAEPDEKRSCAELAEAQAAGQLARETDLLEEQEAGLSDQSEVQRKLIEMDAQAYRQAIYKECLRRRGLAPADDTDG